MAPLARFLEVAGQLKAAWADARAYFSENDCRDLPDQLERLENAEEQLDDALASAESILKACNKLAGKASGQAPSFRSSSAPIGAPARKRSEDEKEHPWRHGAGKYSQGDSWHSRNGRNDCNEKHGQNDWNSKHGSNDWNGKHGQDDWSQKSRPNDTKDTKRMREPVRDATVIDMIQSKRRHLTPGEWNKIRTVERQAKFEESWMPGRTNSNDVYENILPERLARLSQERLRDRLAASIDRWLHNRNKNKESVEDVGVLDQVWNSINFKALFPLIDPPIENLADWISENLDDIYVREGDDGKTLVCQKRQDLESPAYQEFYNAALENFLNSLPDGEFTEEEADLRDAVVNFVQNWPGDSAPLLTEAYSTRTEDGIEVCLAMWALIPRPIKLRDWLEHRMGGEIEMIDPKGGSHGGSMVGLYLRRD